MLLTKGWIWYQLQTVGMKQESKVSCTVSTLKQRANISVGWLNKKEGYPDVVGHAYNIQSHTEKAAPVME